MEIPYLSLKRITDMHAEEIRQACLEVVDSGWYLQGNAVVQFEKSYAEYTGTKHCISCANGLDALTLMLRACKELGRLHEGDEIIVPANTYIATILAITENNLKPVLVEPRLDNFQINDSLIEEAITNKTRAIMLVHLYGYNSYTSLIGELCSKYNLLLFQDCAQAHGLKCGVPENIMCAEAYSFYPGKNLGALADAGAVVTNNDELSDAIRALGNYGSSRKYVFDYKGFNSRMDELNAAVLSIKLKYLDGDNRRRQEIADMYLAGIKNKDVKLPPAEGVHHIFPVLFSNRDKLQSYLASEGIGTMIHYPIPPHKQYCYKEWNGLSLPITELIHSQELSIPLNQAMTNEEVLYIIEKINAYR